MLNHLITHRRVVVFLGLLLTLWLSLLETNVSSHQNHWLTRLNEVLFDARFNASLELTPPAHSGHSIVIVDIDEASLAEHGRWPWSRTVLANLLERLKQYDVAVTAFDMVFSEPERNLLDQLTPEQRAQWQAAHPERTLDADTQFEQALKDMDTVIGFFFIDEHNVRVGTPPKPLYTLTQHEQQHLLALEKSNYVASIPKLSAAATQTGFVTVIADPDGSVRRTPLVMRMGEYLYPSLALATVMTYLLDDNLDLKTAPLGAGTALRYVGPSGQQARTDEVGRVIVPYQGGRKTYPYVSASHVLDGSANPALLEGAIVLVGTSAIGLSDLRTTPVGNEYPGVEVHANIIDAMLSGGFAYQPEWEAGATFTLLLVLGIVLSFLLPRRGAIGVLFISTGTLLATVVGNFMLWHKAGLDLPLAAAILLIVMLTLLALASGFLQEALQRRQLTGMFGQYVPPEHIRQMLNQPDAYQQHSESKVMTVMFADIRGFTELSEHLSPQALTSLLNDYFTPITETIFKHGGTVDKYVGDMVMAFWGAPLDDKEHAHRCVMAALAVQQQSQHLSAQFRAQGRPPLNIGIGINTGMMTVGDMGSAYRKAYTVLGDAVNTASRIEGLTKHYDARILVGEHTRKATPKIHYRRVDRVLVKGKSQPITLYEPLGLFDDTSGQH